VGELAQFPQGDAQLVFRLVDAGALAGVGGGFELGAGKTQREREADQPLLGTVVQVALQPPALGVTGGDDPRAGGTQVLQLRRQFRLEPLVLQRQP
jgi:hypothetical protein